MDTAPTDNNPPSQYFLYEPGWASTQFQSISSCLSLINTADACQKTVHWFKTWDEVKATQQRFIHLLNPKFFQHMDEQKCLQQLCEQGDQAEREQNEDVVRKEHPTGSKYFFYSSLEWAYTYFKVWTCTFSLNVTTLFKTAKAGRCNQIVYKTHSVGKSCQVDIDKNTTCQSSLKQAFAVHDFQDMYIAGEVHGPAIQVWFWGL